ncbi:hypothetical protein E2C01_099511 [Portunus trituberculatus]|uniref:Uncharacterized protein n=1 Tax=Portunus trituberculatus TaxID=210409 RepID=A0A5B7KAK5_PORTR|nr:hypothetical protein [Portunus trituberculatus]
MRDPTASRHEIGSPGNGSDLREHLSRFRVPPRRGLHLISGKIDKTGLSSTLYKLSTGQREITQPLTVLRASFSLRAVHRAHNTAHNFMPLYPA